MATYVVGLILAVIFVLAFRHVWNNFKSGKHDCCGCDACSSKAVSSKKEPCHCGCGGTK